MVGITDVARAVNADFIRQRIGRPAEHPKRWLILLLAATAISGQFRGLLFSRLPALKNTIIRFR
jgi:hypothetical protein